MTGGHDDEHDSHGHHLSKAARRQIDRNQDLRDHAAYYALAGEKVAAFVVAMVDAVHELVAALPEPKRVPKLTRAALMSLVETALEAQDVLEPFRGRVCMEALDAFVECWSPPDDDGGDGDDGPAPEPQPEPGMATPLPAFMDALR